MRHQKTRRRLQRHGSQRRALLNSLVTALFRYQRINTTQVKAKEAQKLAEQLITLGKNPSLHTRRQAFELLGDHGMVKKLFDEIAPLFTERAGGYTRVIRSGHRAGDAAPMAILELVEKTTAFEKTQKERLARIKQKRETKAKEYLAEQQEQVQSAETQENTAAPTKEQKTEKSKDQIQKDHSQKDPKNKKSFVKGLQKFFKRKGQDT